MATSSNMQTKNFKRYLNHIKNETTQTIFPEYPYYRPAAITNIESRGQSRRLGGGGRSTIHGDIISNEKKDTVEQRRERESERERKKVG